MKTKRFQIVNIIAFLAVIVVNALANILPINGKTTGEISDFYSNYFTPAALTFSIWGLIYILLAGFIIYQARGLFRNMYNNYNFVSEIGWLFAASSLANIAWILCWHYQKITLSLIVMLILLISLSSIYLKTKNNNLSKLFIIIPFSIYTGWITIATLANITVFFVDNNILNNPLLDISWTIIAIIIGTIVTSFILFKYRDIFYSLVPIWAFIGIIIKRLNTEAITPIIIAASAGIIIIIIEIFYILFRKKPHKYTF